MEDGEDVVRKCYYSALFVERAMVALLSFRAILKELCSS